MSLELFTAIGALVGGSIAFLIDERFLSVLFAALLGYVAFSMLRARSGAAIGRRMHVSEPAEHAGTHRGDPVPSASRRTAFLASVAGPDYEVRNLGRASSARPARASPRRCWGSVAAPSRSR